MDRVSAARLKLWQQGDLRWKLKPCQLAMLQAIEGSTRFKYVVKCARRLGKSYLLCALAIMACLRKPGAQVRYAAPTVKALIKIVKPIIGKILTDCPRDMRPHFKASENMYVFPNGSEIHLAGVNNGHAEDLRGTACDLFLVDEAGTIAGLDYLVHDIALPQFLDLDGNVVKDRRLVIASSPPRSPAHEFNEIAAEAEVGGYYSHYTIFEGGYSNETIARFLEEDGNSSEDIKALLAGDLNAIKSSTVKREYLALDCVDETRAIIPEFHDGLIGDPIQGDLWRFWQRYEAMDMGTVNDFTALLCATYEFATGTLWIHSEGEIEGVDNTGQIADMIRATELATWPDAETRKPDVRVSDNSHDLLNKDLNAYHGIYFRRTSKERLVEMVNKVRLWARTGRIRVSPKCKMLIGCLRSGVWDSQRKEFDRSKIFGHFDHLAALVYLIRNVDESFNPVPANYGREHSPQEQLYPTPKYMNSHNARELSKLVMKKPRWRNR